MSILNATDRVDSTLPSLSTERYSIVCEPAVVTLNGPLYAVQFAAPCSRYSVLSTPEPPSLSVAVSVTLTSDLY